MEEDSYFELLEKLGRTHPNLASSLETAQRNREERLRRLFHGIRLSGLEELQHYLKRVEATFQEHDSLAKISFLVARARADFETALECVLSGIPTVAADAMRDVMEVEFLLRDFLYEPSHIEEWLNMKPKERYRKFRPYMLRKRHAKRINVAPGDMPEAHDYRGHSAFLHVSPIPFPFGGPGIVEESDAFSADSNFWDMFEHARRLILIIHDLIDQFVPDATYNPNPEEDLDKFKKGWEQTQDMQQMVFSLIEIPSND